MHPYDLRLLAATLAAAGSFLLIEHLYLYGFDVFDIVGHEWYGLILIMVAVVVGVLSRTRWARGAS